MKQLEGYHREQFLIDVIFSLHKELLEFMKLQSVQLVDDIFFIVDVQGGYSLIHVLDGFLFG